MDTPAGRDITNLHADQLADLDLLDVAAGNLTARLDTANQATVAFATGIALLTARANMPGPTPDLNALGHSRAHRRLYDLRHNAAGDLATFALLLDDGPTRRQAATAVTGFYTLHNPSMQSLLTPSGRPGAHTVDSAEKMLTAIRAALARHTDHTDIGTPPRHLGPVRDLTHIGDLTDGLTFTQTQTIHTAVQIAITETTRHLFDTTVRLATHVAHAYATDSEVADLEQAFRPFVDAATYRALAAHQLAHDTGTRKPTGELAGLADQAAGRIIGRAAAGASQHPVDVAALLAGAHRLTAGTIAAAQATADDLTTPTHAATG